MAAFVALMFGSHRQLIMPFARCVRRLLLTVPRRVRIKQSHFMPLRLSKYVLIGGMVR